MPERTTARVQEILSWYQSDSPGTLANLHRMLMTGTLAGTGKMVILPVDQGFEHGPARSFAPNPAGYDPEYHFQLAIEAGCNAYAAAARVPRGRRAQVRGADPAHPEAQQLPTRCRSSRRAHLAVTASVKEASASARLAAIGYTIYPASDARNTQFESLRALTGGGEGARPRACVSYRGTRSVEGGRDRGGHSPRTPRRIACQLGAHVVKVKPPKGPRGAPRGEEGLREVPDPDEDAGRARAPRRAVVVRREAHRDSSPAVEAEGAPRRCSRRSRASRGGRRLRLRSWAAIAFQRPKAEALEAPRRRHEDLTRPESVARAIRGSPGGARSRGGRPRRSRRGGAGRTLRAFPPRRSPARGPAHAGRGGAPAPTAWNMPSARLFAWPPAATRVYTDSPSFSAAFLPRSRSGSKRPRRGRGPSSEERLPCGSTPRSSRRSPARSSRRSCRTATWRWRPSAFADADMDMAAIMKEYTSPRRSGSNARTPRRRRAPRVRSREVQPGEARDGRLPRACKGLGGRVRVRSSAVRCISDSLTHLPEASRRSTRRTTASGRRSSASSR